MIDPAHGSFVQFLLQHLDERFETVIVGRVPHRMMLVSESLQILRRLAIRKQKRLFNQHVFAQCQQGTEELEFDLVGDRQDGGVIPVRRTVLDRPKIG